MKKGRGGPRAGAGRKQGSVPKRIRKISDMTQSAIDRIRKVPLEVMLRNMDRFDREAEVMFGKLHELIENARPPKNASRSEHKAFFDEIKDLMMKMRECRMDAQKCAVDAAPYMHSRRAQITIKDEMNHLVAKPEIEQTEEELADYYAKLRSRPLTSEPLIIDNETGAPVSPSDDNEEFEFENG